MSIYNIGDMTECNHEEYRRIYNKHKDKLTVFSSYSGGIIGMPEMSTAWGIKGMETALIASECENWEHRREDTEAWTYWANKDLVMALDREADHAAEVERMERQVRELRDDNSILTTVRDGWQQKFKAAKSIVENIRAERDAAVAAKERAEAERDELHNSLATVLGISTQVPFDRCILHAGERLAGLLIAVNELKSELAEELLKNAFVEGYEACDTVASSNFADLTFSERCEQAWENSHAADAIAAAQDAKPRAVEPEGEDA